MLYHGLIDLYVLRRLLLLLIGHHSTGAIRIHRQTTALNKIVPLNSTEIYDRQQQTRRKETGAKVSLAISSNHQCSQLLQCDGCHTSSPVPCPTKFAGLQTSYNPCELHHLLIILQCFGCLQAKYNWLGPSNAAIPVHMVESTESSLNDDLVVRDFRLWFVGFQSGHFASHIAKLYIRFLLDG